MATTEELKQRIANSALALAVPGGDVDDCNALSWLDAIETHAIEIGDTDRPLRAGHDHRTAAATGGRSSVGHR